jgi:hypothetical protein
MKLSFTILVGAVLATTVSFAAEFSDDFSKSDVKTRQAQRGDWKFENNEARCVSDPKLYKKFKNHGPILKWPGEFKDGVIEFEVWPQKCQRLVFTLNGDGHIFRVILLDPQATGAAAKGSSRIIAWATKSSKENKGTSIRPKGLPELTAVDGKWTRVRLTVSGNKGELSIGDFKTKIDHAALGRAKNLVMISFAQGSLAVRGFKMSTK